MMTYTKQSITVLEESTSDNLSLQSRLCCSVVVTKGVFSCMSQPFLSVCLAGMYLDTKVTN